ncbi:MAG: prepilin-type N-terminal cleavage/methylation domain-containing protein [Candidatus Paceibacterota bacterium]|jgi:prepilin-type N-terminal cleavage/methylation domain-containing protein|nr:prepilin-type N-terminal cleavage/methylation domain-containing protein [bacterium]
MQNKGFTLIELLVVIAIIGILAGIIVVSMGGAQNAAKDAKVQSTLSQMRTAAQMYYMNNNNYTSLAADTNYAALASSLSSISTVTTVIKTGNADYCAYATIPSAPTTYWCVDSAGNSKVSTVTSCVAATAVCN